MKHRLLALATVSATTLVAVAQTVPQSQPDAAQQQMFENLPWAVKLGLRAQQVSQAIPTVDRVVLVPDAATYLDELGKWSLKGRWPVLVEDAHFAPMFVRRFAPAQLVRRPSINQQLPAEAQTRQRMLESVVTRAFGGDPASVTPRQAFEKQKYIPPGLVITSVNDSAWTAAVALAAGHGQPLAWIDEPFGGPNDNVDPQLAKKLIAAIDQQVAAQNYPYQKLGDALDAITVCRNIALSANMPGGASPAAVPQAHQSGPVAMTDLIGRNADGSRYAYTGWIFGDETRCAYMAMCSLFLPREQAIMFNTYPTDGGWGSYGMAEANAVLRASGYNVRDFDTSNADEKAWLRLINSGIATDLFIINSKGNADYFELSSGKGTTGDVPVLHQPIALHMIHSWSMKAPDDDRTIAARWLDHGAYAAVGSCWEPMLSAFVPPTVLSKRISSFVPFLVAARWWDGEPGIAQPWRIVTIGDPLMIAQPPQQQAQMAGVIKRVQLPIEAGEDLNERLKEYIRAAPNDPTGKSAAEAISILNMLGKDQIATQVWTIALQQKASDAAARPALDVFFRTRNIEEFIKAWQQLDKPDSIAQDMLWHLAAGRIDAPGGAGSNRDLLLLLQDNVREWNAVADVQRLAPIVARASGVGEARIMIQRTIAKVQQQYLKDELQELMKQY